mmetsp:Transcript_17739/g.35864  ORF Transcript_17739/g.35864 Transcript_17739/m.35864 type:complete len:140 (-) Transcript_17739:36-455(-)
MGFTLITTIPDVCNVKCLCYKCGLQNMPNLASDWWCDNVCCCLFNQFGLKELLDCQIFFLGPCKLTAPALNLTTSIPDCLVVNILLTKYGCQMPMDCLKEDMCTNKCFCIHSEFGLKDLFNIFQFFCLKCETGVKIGPH